MDIIIESIALYMLVETAFSEDPTIFDDDGNEYYIKDFIIENEDGRCKMTVTLVDCETYKNYECLLLKRAFEDYHYRVVIFDDNKEKEVKMENKSDNRGDCVGCLIESISLDEFIKKAASKSTKIFDDYGNEYYIAEFDLINYKGPGLLKHYIKEVVLFDCETLQQYNCVLLKKFKGGDLFSLYITDFEEESAKKNDKAIKRKGYAVFLKHEDDTEDHIILWGRMTITKGRADAVRPYLFDTPNIAANAVRHMIERPHWKIQSVSYMDLDENYEPDSTGGKNGTTNRATI